MKKKTISRILRFDLAIIVLISFLVSTSVVYFISTGVNKTNYENIINTTLCDIEKDIENTSNVNMLTETHFVGDKIEAELSKNNYEPQTEKFNEYLKYLTKENGFSEISIGGEDNVIIYSSRDYYVGFDMNKNPDTREFDKLNHGKKEITQPVRANAYKGEGNYDKYNKYAGVSLKNGGYIQAAINAKQFQKQIDTEVKYIASNRHIGDSGYVIISNVNDNIISNANGDTDVNLSKTGIELNKNTKQDKTFTADVNGCESMYMYRFVEGYYIIGVVPMDEVQYFRNRAVTMNSIIAVFIFTVMFMFISLLMEKIVVSRLRNVNRSLHKIIEGELDTTVNEYYTEEFALLSEDINLTVNTLKKYTEKEKERIENELTFAKSIQEGALPKPDLFNTTDDRFDLYATMHPARAVGGDFYDFYKLNDDKLAVLIADVSGKGIPAAMFMMTSKGMLKNLVGSGRNLEEAFAKANEELIENNDAEMFVTVWIGIINLNTGHVEYINAGHNHPLVYNEKGEFEYLKCKANFVLTGMPGARYDVQKFNLKPGNKLYLYTDGVTETNNPESDMYGEDRLLDFINTNRDNEPKEILFKIKENIDEFADDAEQFDDITMLCVKYNGNSRQLK